MGSTKQVDQQQVGRKSHASAPLEMPRSRFDHRHDLETGAAGKSRPASDNSSAKTMSHSRGCRRRLPHQAGELGPPVDAAEDVAKLSYMTKVTYRPTRQNAQLDDRFEGDGGDHWRSGRFASGAGCRRGWRTVPISGAIIERGITEQAKVLVRTVNQKIEAARHRLEVAGRYRGPGTDGQSATLPAEQLALAVARR